MFTLGPPTEQPHWLPYEIFDRQKYNHKLDIYSYGMMIWECVTTEIPFSGMDAFSLIGKMLKDKNLRPPIPADCHPTIESLMKRCWHSNPKKRPEFSEIIATLDSIKA
jgi:serine/threonine protein kinase